MLGLEFGFRKSSSSLNLNHPDLLTIKNFRKNSGKKSSLLILIWNYFEPSRCCARIRNLVRTQWRCAREECYRRTGRPWRSGYPCHAGQYCLLHLRSVGHVHRSHHERQRAKRYYLNASKLLINYISWSIVCSADIVSDRARFDPIRFTIWKVCT